MSIDKKKYDKYKSKYINLKKTYDNNQIGGVFNNEKEELLELLLPYTNKLLFPQTIINSLERWTITTLSGYMDRYNSTLRKIRSLHHDLFLLKKWGLIYDSYYSWKTSVNINIGFMNTNNVAIIDTINSANDFISKSLMNQCNIKADKIFIFMSIIKKNKKYTLFNQENNQEIELSIDNINSLFPRCLNPVEIGAVLSLEPMHYLENSELFEQ
jgi:hypothetical protein